MRDDRVVQGPGKRCKGMWTAMASNVGVDDEVGQAGKKGVQFDGWRKGSRKDSLR